MPSNVKRKLVAIVFTDIAGFTQLSAVDEDAAFDLIEKQNKILKPIVEKFNGNWLKETGDGLVLSFPSSLEAVQCSIEIQHTTKEIEGLNLRIGIHQGDILEKDGDIFGDDVNVASRIEPYAATGGIAISDKVQRDIASHPEFDIKWIAQPSLKGVLQEIKVYCIISHNLPTTKLSDINVKTEKKQSVFNYKNVLLVVAFVGILLYFFYSSFSDTDRITLIPKHQQITFSGNVTSFRISPDGNFVAYVEFIKDKGHSKLLLRDLSTKSTITLLDSTFNSPYFEWSPDGEKILFPLKTSKEKMKSGSKTALIPKLGGDPHFISSNFYYKTWNPNGNKIAGTWAPAHKIWIENIETGLMDTIKLSVSEDHLWISKIDWSPNGEYILVNTLHEKNKDMLWLYNLNNQTYNKLLEDSLRIDSPTWSSTGNVIYFLQSNNNNNLFDLYKLPIDIKTSLSSEDPKLVLSSLNHYSTVPWQLSFSIAKEQNKLIHPRGFDYCNIILFEIENNNNEFIYNKKPLTFGTSLLNKAKISPNGKQIVYTRIENATEEIYMMTIDGKNQRQLTFLNASSTSPAWSPDGTEIAFGSNKSGKYQVWKLNIITNELHKYSQSNLSESSILEWGGGEKILYHKPGNANFSMLDPITEEEEDLLEILGKSDGWVFYPLYSPDGSKILVSRHKYGNNSGIYMIEVDSKHEEFIADETYYALAWSEDGNHIICENGKKEMIKIDISSKEEKLLFTIPNDFSYELYTALYSKKLYIGEDCHSKSDLWLINNFDPDF